MNFRTFALACAFAAMGSVPVVSMTAQAQAVAGSNLSEGTWTKKSFAAAGKWEIYEDKGKTYVRLSPDFQTRNAPDLKLFLSPRLAADVTGKTAVSGSLQIAPLQSNKGEQVYELPAGTNLAGYKSILIHCEAYTKLWAAADLFSN